MNPILYIALLTGATLGFTAAVYIPVLRTRLRSLQAELDLCQRVRDQALLQQTVLKERAMTESAWLYDLEQRYDRLYRETEQPNHLLNNQLRAWYHSLQLQQDLQPADTI